MQYPARYHHANSLTTRIYTQQLWSNHSPQVLRNVTPFNVWAHREPDILQESQLLGQSRQATWDCVYAQGGRFRLRVQQMYLGNMHAVVGEPGERGLSQESNRTTQPQRLLESQKEDRSLGWHWGLRSMFLASSTVARSQGSFKPWRKESHPEGWDRLTWQVCVCVYTKRYLHFEPVPPGTCLRGSRPEASRLSQLHTLAPPCRSWTENLRQRSEKF